MPDLIQRSFAAGEIAPALYARADQVKYQTGARLARNFFVQKAGGLANRPGLQFVRAATHFFQRLMKYIRNDRSFVLEVSYLGGADLASQVRFINNRRFTILSDVSPTTWAFAVQYRSGDVVLHAGVYYIARVDSLDVIPPNSTFWAPAGASLTGDYFQTIWLRGNLGYIENAIPALAPPLRYAQSGDIVIITAPYPGTGVLAPVEVFRQPGLKFGQRSYDPSIIMPTPSITAHTNSSGTFTVEYQVTAVGANGEESLPSAIRTITSAALPTTTTPITLTISTVLDAVEYHVYRAISGKFNFVGVWEPPRAVFTDTGVTPDFSSAPPRQPITVLADGAFLHNFNAPTVVGFLQQRTVFAASIRNPETVWMSRIGQYRNHTNSLPTQDDDAIAFQLAARDVSSPVAVLELGMPVLLTTSGEWVLKGDADGALLPTAIGATRHAYNGCSPYVQPVVVNDTCLYVQSRGSYVRDFRYKVESEGYDGRDLSVYAPHLFDGFTIVAMDYAANPDSLIYAVRSDGVMLVLSYLREHQIWGWTQYTTDGRFKDVAVIPEGIIDAVYVIVERFIDGVWRRYIERFAPRVESNTTSAFFVDSGLTYDGTTTSTLTINPQLNMTVNDQIRCNTSPGLFTASSVGDAMDCYAFDGDGNLLGTLRMTIVTFSGASEVWATPSVDLSGPKADPLLSTLVGLEIATNRWRYAADTITGLVHLRHRTVAILADGAVLADGYTEPFYTVTATGEVTLPRPAAIAHIGLPYRADMESLDLEARDGTTVRARNKNITHVGVLVKSTSALKAGTSFDKLTEYKIREFERMGEPTALKTGFFDVAAKSGWDEETRVCVRQDQPLPCTVSGLIPRFMIEGAS